MTYQAAPAPAGARLGLRILIVDDRPANLVALEEILADTGVVILRANSGQEALELTLRHDFALVILDVQMPEMDGYEVAKLLRGDPNTAQMPIIFVSAAYADEQHQFDGYDVGAVDYIVKPFVPEVLLAKVRVFLELASYRLGLEAQVAERTEALVASERRYRLLAEAMKDVVWTMDEDQGILYVTPSIRELTGHDPCAYCALPPAQRYPQATQAALQAVMSAEADAGAATETAAVDVQINDQRDRLLWVEVRVSRVSEGQEDGSRFVVVARDVGRRRALEETQRQQARELAEAVERQKRLLREIHHRVKNNLQFIPSLMRMEVRKSGTEEVRALTDRVIRRVTAMGRAHDRLHDVAASDVGRYLVSLVRDLREITPDGIRVHVDIDAADVSLPDMLPVGLIVNELVTNALQHAFPADARGSVAVGLHRCADLATIVVEDDGKGMAGAGQEKGGIGLDLVNGLARLIGGTVTAEARAEGGTRVRVDLPTSKPPAGRP